MAYLYNAYTPFGQFNTYSSSQGLFNAPTSAPQIPASSPAPQPMASAGGFVCRPVTSRAEAEFYQIPFDGSTTYFVDTSNGNLYSKTFDFNTGTAPLVTYVRETVRPVQYATVDDLNALRKELTGGAEHDE